MSKDKKYEKELHQDVFERIEKYLDGSMSCDELSAFEHEMQQNDLLRNEVELQQKLQTAVVIDAIGKAYHEKEKLVPTKSTTLELNLNSWGWKVAAVVVILAIPVYFLFFSTTDLYQKYYEVDPGLPTEMGVSENYEFHDAMVDYKMENYQQAQDKWTQLLVQHPNNDTLNYYLAMTDLNLDAYAKSYKKLEQIPTTSAFYKDALWYQALIAIQQKNYELARAKLEELDTQQANEVLKELP